MINPAHLYLPFHFLLHRIQSAFVWQEESPKVPRWTETSFSGFVTIKRWKLNWNFTFFTLPHMKAFSRCVGVARRLICWAFSTTEEQQTNTALWQKGTYRHKKGQHDIEQQWEKYSDSTTWLLSKFPVSEGREVRGRRCCGQLHQAQVFYS